MSLMHDPNLKSPITTNMSEDLADIHPQTSAILEKLYDQKGQPEEVDASFAHEYFKLVNRWRSRGISFEGSALN
jgi:hypothetical protein